MANKIDSLIEAATGSPCPGRQGGACPFQPPVEVSERPALRAVS